MRLKHLSAWLLALNVSVQAAEYTRLKLDETIVFYPSIAQRIPGSNAWRVDIRGLVFEPENRPIMLGAVHQALNLKHITMSASEQKILNQRVRLFLVDHERRKKIFIRHGAKTFSAGKSRRDGLFHHEFILQEASFEKKDEPLPKANIPLTIVLSSNDTRTFSTEIFFLEETGLSVISDIDDTIKVSEVRDRNALLRNTLLRDFSPVRGMAEFYQILARSNNAQFHYLSASPWQLYEPLAEFVRSNGFPRGTFFLKEFRWKNRTFLSLFSDPEKYKPQVIEPLLKRFPKRRFILIGDSGERDPEVYAAITRKYPKQIERIYIRDVTGESEGAERYRRTFDRLPRELWHVFANPSEMTFTPSQH